MSRFVIHINESKRKKLLVWGCLYIAMAVFSVAMLAYDLFYDVGTMRRIFYVLCVTNFGAGGYERLQKRKRKEYFLEIDQESLTWSMHQTEKPISILWDDIRWIKKEKDEAIMIFRESSFSVGFPMADFREEEKLQIVELIEHYAAQREIRMINFSTPVLATA
jgi:hypothetical protein